MQVGADIAKVKKKLDSASQGVFSACLKMFFPSLKKCSVKKKYTTTFSLHALQKCKSQWVFP